MPPQFTATPYYSLDFICLTGQKDRARSDYGNWIVITTNSGLFPHRPFFINCHCHMVFWASALKRWFMHIEKQPYDSNAHPQLGSRDGSFSVFSFVSHVIRYIWLCCQNNSGMVPGRCRRTECASRLFSPCFGLDIQHSSRILLWPHYPQRLVN